MLLGAWLRATNLGDVWTSSLTWCYGALPPQIRLAIRGRARGRVRVRVRVRVREIADTDVDFRLGYCERLAWRGVALHMAHGVGGRTKAMATP